jgi:hypothetical protein
VQPPLLSGTLPLPEAIQLQPHGECQVQQGDKTQQLVACTSPLVFSRPVAGAELSRQVTWPQCLLQVLCSGGPTQVSPWQCKAREMGLGSPSYKLIFRLSA